MNSAENAPTPNTRTQAIVLAWNNLITLRQSVKRIAREVPVIVIDNDSKDGTGLWFADHPIENVTYQRLEKNEGVSAKNYGIDMVTTPYYFLIDGDSVYVPGTIKEYEKILDKHPECGNIGYCDPEERVKKNLIGTNELFKADQEMIPGVLYEGMKQVWAGYGLFRKTKARFPREAPFNEPGWGWEDQWFLKEMETEGLKPYFMDKPLYYHNHHSSWNHLKDKRIGDRQEAYEKRWGKFQPDLTYKKVIN